MTFKVEHNLHPSHCLSSFDHHHQYHSTNVVRFKHNQCPYNKQTNKQTTCTTATKLIHKPTIQQSSIPPFIRKQHLQSNNLLIPKCPTIGLIYYSIPSPITQLLLAIQQHSRHKRRFCLGLGSITTLPHQRSWYRRCRCGCGCGRS